MLASYLATYLATYLTCLLNYLLNSLTYLLASYSVTYLTTYLPTYLLTPLPTYLLAYLPTYSPSYLLICFPTYLLATRLLWPPTGTYQEPVTQQAGRRNGSSRQVVPALSYLPSTSRCEDRPNRYLRQTRGLVQWYYDADERGLHLLPSACSLQLAWEESTISHNLGQLFVLASAWCYQKESALHS